MSMIRRWWLLFGYPVMLKPEEWDARMRAVADVPRESCLTCWARMPCSTHAPRAGAAE